MTGCRHLAKSISKIKPISHTVELRILSFYLKKDKGGQNLERRIIKIAYKNVWHGSLSHENWCNKVALAK